MPLTGTSAVRDGTHLCYPPLARLSLIARPSHIGERLTSNWRSLHGETIHLECVVLCSPDFGSPASSGPVGANEPAASQPARGAHPAHRYHRHYDQLLPPPGQRTKDLGQPGSLRTGVASRGQGEHRRPLSRGHHG